MTNQHIMDAEPELRRLYAELQERAANERAALTAENAKLIRKNKRLSGEVARLKRELNRDNSQTSTIKEQDEKGKIRLFEKRNGTAGRSA